MLAYRALCDLLSLIFFFLIHPTTLSLSKLAPTPLADIQFPEQAPGLLKDPTLYLIPGMHGLEVGICDASRICLRSNVGL